MASSKASMLKNGAKKASKGLFKDMQKLSEIESHSKESNNNENAEKKPEVSEVKAVVEKTEEKQLINHEVEAVTEPVKESTAAADEKINSENANNVNNVNNVNNSTEADKVLNEKQEPEEAKTVVIDKNETASDVQPKKINMTSAVNENSGQALNPVETVAPIQFEPVNQTIQPQMTQPQITSQLQQPVVPNEYQQIQQPIQQPVQQFVDNNTQPMPQVNVQQPQNIAYAQPQPANNGYQQALYMNQPQYTPEQMERAAYLQQQSMYNQPVQQPVQQQMMQPLQDQHYSKPRTAEKASKQEKGSRYEKDKFLLLDIRGYRDYVEHMAKAANMSATKYIRNLIEQDMRINNDIYQEQKRLEEMFKGRF